MPIQGAVHRFRLPAIVCSFLVLLCAMVSLPRAEMGVADDWSYVLTARILAQTGHFVYNGWATAMLGWQVYLAALFFKFFGSSFFVARMSTLAVSMLTAFLIQRLMVRCRISEGNAVIGTLAITLTPIYLQLSVTFMTDIQGFFAIVLCLYACLRALQTNSERNRLLWICFAIGSNVILGSARQTGWLGVLVIVPCTLWRLRSDRRLLLIGTVASVFGWVGVFLTLRWFSQQPYALVEPLSFKIGGLHGLIYVSRQLLKAVLEPPFLVLPIVLIFIPQVRRAGRSFALALLSVCIIYSAVAVHLTRNHSPSAMLEPLLGDWYTAQGYYQAPTIYGTNPILMGLGTRLTLTLISTVACLCFLAFLWSLRRLPKEAKTGPLMPGLLSSSWGDLLTLLIPFTLAYYCLLIPRATANLRDRYLVPLSFVFCVIMIRLYQEHVHQRLPRWSALIVALTALFSVACTHDLFSFYRARISLANELTTYGVSPNNIDGGFEYDGWTELMTAGHINDPRLKIPLQSFVTVDPHRGLVCGDQASQEVDSGSAHLVPLYGFSYTADACAGLVPVSPVQFSRWLHLDSDVLYAVKFKPRS